MVNSIAAALLAGLFPNYCVLCGLRSNRGVPLCRDCQGEL
jgi:predicted amidophosphoribosyltransferase